MRINLWGADAPDYVQIPGGVSRTILQVEVPGPMSNFDVAKGLLEEADSSELSDLEYRAVLNYCFRILQDPDAGFYDPQYVHDEDGGGVVESEMLLQLYFVFDEELDNSEPVRELRVWDGRLCHSAFKGMGSGVKVRSLPRHGAWLLWR